MMVLDLINFGLDLILDETVCVIKRTHKIRYINCVIKDYDLITFNSKLFSEDFHDSF